MSKAKELVIDVRRNCGGSSEFGLRILSWLSRQPIRNASARICVKRDVYPDGSAFVGKGVMPDVEVRRTVASLRAGADPVLDRAVAELRK